MKVASSWTVLVAVACAVPVCAGELAFKGVPMGSPKSALFQTFVGISCRVPGEAFRDDGEEVCDAPPGSIDFGGVRADGVMFRIVAGRVEGFEATFPWSSYERMRDAAVALYGPGVESVQMLQGQFTQPFPSRIWRATVGGGASVVIFERAGAGQGLASGATGALKQWAERNRRRRRPRGD